MKRALVTGAGGFIGGHLVSYLKARGFWVRGADIKHHEFRETEADDFMLVDLRDADNCRRAVAGCDWVFQLAANMGGMGHIGFHHAEIMHDNLLINVNMAEAAKAARVERYFFSSSACVYPNYMQNEVDSLPLREQDAYPADPQGGYGWEKLTTEKLLLYYQANGWLPVVRIARFHNTYGPYGAWNDGREKAPAALCRKVAEQIQSGDVTVWLPRIEETITPFPYKSPPRYVNIDVWGDGEQTRTFMYVDDNVEGIFRLMVSDYDKPLNLGRDELVSINQLADAIGEAAGVSVNKRHDMTKPQGVRGRNSDNSMCRRVLGWEPQITLEDGIAKTYPWIAEQVANASIYSR